MVPLVLSTITDSKFMRNIIFIFSVFFSGIVQGQMNSFYCTDCFIELCNPKNFDLDERKSGKSIDLYQYNKNPDDTNDTLKVVNVFKIKFLENGVFQLKAKKNQSKFWKTEYYIFDYKGYVWDCRKNGKLRFDSAKVDYTKKEHFNVENDSIVVEIKYWNNSKDTQCMFLDKYVYREGILREEWHKYSPFDGCDWRVGKYNIKVYSYLNQNQTRIDFSRIDGNNNVIKDDYFAIITYDDLGNNISNEYFLLSNPNVVVNGFYRIYKDGKLKELKDVYNSEVIEVYRFP